MINAERRFEHGEKREAWLNGEPLAQIDAGSPEVLTTLHTDHLASPRAGSNAAGSTVWTWESGAFGKEAATGSATVNLRFPGQYFDAETALHYNWNRYYNPATGRYISGDPIGQISGLAIYNYSAQNPLGLVDIQGLMEEPYDPTKHTPKIDDPNTDTPKYNCVADAVCNKSAWVNNPDPILDACYIELRDDQPNEVGDVVKYSNILPSEPEQIHVGEVEEVDAKGNTTKIRSKEGEGGVSHHHPGDPSVGYNTPSVDRTYYRRKPGPCCADAAKSVKETRNGVTYKRSIPIKCCF